MEMIEKRFLTTVFCKHYQAMIKSNRYKLPSEVAAGKKRKTVYESRSCILILSDFQSALLYSEILRCESVLLAMERAPIGFNFIHAARSNNRF